MPLTIDIPLTGGDAIRLALLMTHYRKPLDFGALVQIEGSELSEPTRVSEARKMLRKWLLACHPTLAKPPQEFIDTLADDLNTPGCIALLHKYCANREGDKLFASLRFLGFFSSVKLPREMENLPQGHSWEAKSVRGEMGPSSKRRSKP